jgi:Glycosyl hydrolase catalytic core
MRVACLILLAAAGCSSHDAEPRKDLGPSGELGSTGDLAVSAAGCKRGIAANAAPGSAFARTSAQPGVSWWYNWALDGSGNDPSIEHVPMVWGTSSLGDALPAGAKYVLGFNEPNFKAQSNLTPEQAAADWPQVEAQAKATGAAIVSPAVNFCGSASDPSRCSDSTVTDPYTWLKDFFAACAGCQVDYLAVHWYNCDLPSLQGYIDGSSSLQGFVQFGRPIWLTEFSCDGSHSAADQAAYMKQAVPYLEGNPHVFRYSWFSATPIPSSLLANGDGTLTDLGKTYVALPQSCP